MTLSKHDLLSLFRGNMYFIFLWLQSRSAKQPLQCGISCKIGAVRFAPLGLLYLTLHAFMQLSWQFWLRAVKLLASVQVRSAKVQNQRSCQPNNFDCKRLPSHTSPEQACCKITCLPKMAEYTEISCWLRPAQSSTAQYSTPQPVQWSFHKH